jgi:hypothetical protein
MNSPSMRPRPRSTDLRMGVQIFARSVGNYGSDDPEIDWAYANYR